MTRNLQELFQSSVRNYPDGIALRFGSETLTYAELDRRANRLAHHLRGLGVGPDVPVAIALERGMDMPLAVLAVIKAGGAYVPLDPDYPADRLTRMIADAAPPVLITSEALVSSLPASHAAVVRVDSPSAWSHQSDVAPEGCAGPEDLAYVIFTSGSTGRPKGVAMPQRPLINLIEWQITASSASSGDRTLQFAPLSFDVSFQEIWSTWASGGELVLAGDEIRLDAQALLALCEELSIMRLFLPFTALQHVAETAAHENRPLPQALREVITAGEQLQITPAIREMFQTLRGCRLTNQYGPSETHVVTAFDLNGDPSTWEQLPPIGSPLPAVRAWVLDSSGNEVAGGEPGELFLGGAAPARGYIGRPELTAERFVAEPGGTDGGSPGTMYRTGDLVSRRPDGTLEFLGREDGQVKVRGYRIEVGEVEVALSEHPSVAQAVVGAREVSPGDRRLYAWIVDSTGSKGAGTSELRQHLAARLPDYMIPSAFINLDSFPRTSSGKVDRLALPNPAAVRPVLDVEYESPRSGTEREVAAVWQEILQLDRVGAQDDFFELGGTSLLALRATSELRHRLRREISVVRIFEHATPRRMAAFLEGNRQTTDALSRKRGERVRAGRRSTDIAITGMAGRFPGARDVAELWKNLEAGADTITHFTLDKIDPRIDTSDPAYVPARGVMSDADMFDNGFFGETRGVAEVIDPQQRVLLEVAWAALEDAGLVPDRFSGTIGVFAGVGNNSYYPMNIATRPDVIRSVGEFQVMTGNEKDYPATRIAHKMGLTGPALSIQTACSTSLVAVVEGVRSLLAGECDAALAGGASVTVPQNSGHIYLDGAMLSPDGRCRPFAADSAGTVFSDGAGVVVMKRAEDAIADGDRIYALIRGAAINNDGAGKSSFTAPSVQGQAAVIAMAQASGDIDPDTIGYVEAHGTATPIGDPIEVEALSAAFRARTSRTGFCALGSIKGNIGHLTAAAGVAGLIKASLALHKEEIPPSINCPETNPNIDFESSPFFVNTAARSWPRTSSPRRAAVSSFGVGGTNAHVILEEAPPDKTVSAPLLRQKHLLLLSAKSAASLEFATANLRNYLQVRQPDPSALADIGYTLHKRRAKFGHRRFVVVSDSADAVDALRDLPGERSATRATEARNPEVAFLFPGQGSQYVGMGKEIYAVEPIFRAAVDECAVRLQPLIGQDLRRLMFPPDGDAGAAADALIQTSITQPALFTVGYALTKLWESWGVRPSAMVGHSIGELVAACIADVLSLDDALTMVSERGRLMQSVPRGSMLSVRASASDIEAMLAADGDDSIALAASNGPSLSVVSGPSDRIASFEEKLTARGTISRQLQTSHGFHSSMMDPIVQPFLEVVRGLTLRPPKVPIVSTVTGKWLTDTEAQDPGYWATQMRQPVRFAEAVSTLWEDPSRVLLEMGPRGTAATMARQQARDRSQVAVSSLGESGGDEWTALLSAAGRLWNAGVEIDTDPFWGEGRSHATLPTYAFERTRHWIEPGRIMPVSTDIVVQKVELLPSDAVVDVPRRERILTTILSIIEEASGVAVSAADSRTTFLEMGLDSLFLTQIALTLGRQLGAKVSFRQLLETWPTPISLAAHLDETLPEEAAAPASGQNQHLQSPTATAEQALPPPFVLAEEKPKKHVGPMARIDRSTSHELTPKQREGLARFTELYCTRLAKSKEFTAKNRHHLADPRVVSGFSPLRKEITFPIVCDRSKGSKLWDLDGNEYVDLTNGFGAAFFGHTPDVIVDAVREQMLHGIEIGPQHPMVAEVATLFCELTGNERVAWCNTGSEAVLGAMRAARTVTGRSTIAVFEGGYHGIFDEVIVRGTKSLRSIPAAPGIPPSHVQNILVLEYGTPETLRILKERSGELAAIMIETVQSRRPSLQPRAFLHACRKIADESGAALIFDEVITGFRIRAGGAQEYFGVKADLATYGKILGGGMPIGAIGGRPRFMDAFDGGAWQFGDDSAPEAGVTYFAGTFVRHPPALAAARAALAYLSAHPEVYDAVSARAAGFATRVNESMKSLGAPVRLDRFGSQLKIRIDEDLPHGGLFYHWLRSKGVHAWEGRPCFVTMGHNQEDIDKLVQAFEDSAREMQAAELFPVATGTALGERPAPTTEAQREIWASIQLGGGDQNPDAASLAYNETCAVKLEGPLDPYRLEVAMAGVVMRHEALRSRFSLDGTAFYVDDSDVNVDLALEDLSSLSEPERAARLARIAREEATAPFQLHTGPVWRARLTRVSQSEHFLWFTAHHIVCDGWSTAVVLHDVGRLYSGEDPGRAESFVEYAFSQRSPAHREKVDDDLAFWRNRLGEAPQLELPADRTRPAIRTYAAGRVDHELPPEIVTNLKRVGAASGASFVASMLAAFAAFVSRIAMSDDLIIGLPTAGQSVAGKDLLLGHAVNVLPLRVEVDQMSSFAAHLAKVQRLLLDAYDHQNLSFGELIQSLGLPRDPSRIPLVPVVFNVDTGIDDFSLEGLRSTFISNPREFDTFELFINASSANGRLVIEAQFNRALFDQATIEGYLQAFERMLKSALADPDRSISRLTILEDREREKILKGFNATDHAGPWRQSDSLMSLFHAAADKTPEDIAILSEQRQLTYRELDEASNRMARVLRARGAVPETTVGICLERSVELVIAVYAVLKTGAAFVPLEPENPAERLAGMIEDAAPVVVIVDDRTSEKVGSSAAVLNLKVVEKEIEDSSPARLPLQVSASDLAYVIFTSGSTGRPKGVMNEHRGVVNFLAWFHETFSGAGRECIALKTPFGFDVSVPELLAPIFGVQLAVLEPGAHRDPLRIARAVERFAITTLQFVPSMLHMFVADPENVSPGRLGTLRRIVAGGEALPADLAERVRSAVPDVALFNVYGPTEAAVWASVHSCIAPSPTPIVPIGKPIYNTRFYVVDQNLEPTPIGVPGELLIGGTQVARGYIGKPELTADRFITDPFAPSGASSRLYRTGDLARWRHDGEVEFLGRNDHQVKLRGVRIELAEIEAAILDLPFIEQVAVVVRKIAAGDDRLVAYVVPGEGISVSAAGLRKELRTSLPDSMIPQHVVSLRELPLNLSGKLDRKALPPPQELQALDAHEEAASETERAVAELWKQLLSLSIVSRGDNFFDLGGHSLKALEAVAALKAASGIRLDPRLFMLGTLSQIASELDAGIDARTPAHALLAAQNGNIEDEKADALIASETSGNDPRGKIGLYELIKERILG